MKSRIPLLATFAVFAFASSPPASAHDQSLHKGKATEGEIVSVEPGRFLMKAEGEERRVSFDAETKIELGHHAAGSEDLERGAHVAVFGTKLPGGEIVAKEILIHPDPAPGGSIGHHDEAGPGARE